MAGATLWSRPQISAQRPRTAQTHDNKSRLLEQRAVPLVVPTRVREHPGMRDFPSTQWSLIRGSALSQADRRDAFGTLTHAYRPAIRAFLRARLPPAEVDDALQTFLTQSWEHAWFARADPEFGSFRGFLLVMLRRHVGRWRERYRIDSAPVSDEDAAFIDQDPAIDPQRAFDRRFLAALTQQAVQALRGAYVSRGRAGIFDALLPMLTSGPEKGDLSVLAERLAVPANTLSVELKRLRDRLGAAMRAELTSLCTDQETAEREWRELRG